MDFPRRALERAVLPLLLAILVWIFCYESAFLPHVFGWDQSVHALHSYGYYQALRNRDLGEILSISDYYPPLLGLTSALLYFPLGFSIKTALFTNQIYLIVGGIFVYLVVKDLSGRRWLAILACLTFLTTPLAIRLDQRYLLDYSLGALIAPSYYFLLKSDFMRDVKYSALFGLSTGLAMLAKWSALVFIISALITSLILSRKNIRGFMKSLAVFLAVLFLVCGWWYVPKVIWALTNFHYATHKLLFYAGASKVSNTTMARSPSKIPSFLFYFYVLPKDFGSSYLALFLASVASFFYLIIKRGKDKVLIGSMLLIALNFLIWIFIPNRKPRYIYPVYPLMTCFSFISLSRALPLERNWKKVAFGVLSALVLVSSAVFLAPSLKPNEKEGQWNQCLQELAMDFKKEFSSLKGNCSGIDLDNGPFTNGDTIEVYLLQEGMTKIKVVNGAFLYFDYYLRGKRLRLEDYQIIMVPNRLNKSEAYFGFIKEMYSQFLEIRKEYSLQFEVKLPNGERLLVYCEKKRNVLPKH